MPVTAKLSRAFYNKLGDEVANEPVDWFNTVDLSYRAEFRAMFETHFSRFEARLAQQTAELRAESRNDLAQFRVEFTDRMNQLESRLVRLMFRYWIGTLAATIGLILGARQLLD